MHNAYQNFSRLALSVMMAGCSVLANARSMQVQVRETQLRATPSFLGKIITTSAYGDQVDVRETRDAWSQVTLADGQTGWMHTSALTTKTIRLQVGETAAATAASSDELALAGKGFNSDVEAEFKRRNREIDFKWVDRMEKMDVSAEEMRTFLGRGGLTAAGGE